MFLPNPPTRLERPRSLFTDIKSALVHPEVLLGLDPRHCGSLPQQPYRLLLYHYPGGVVQLVQTSIPPIVVRRMVPLIWIYKRMKICPLPLFSTSRSRTGNDVPHFLQDSGNSHPPRTLYVMPRGHLPLPKPWDGDSWPPERCDATVIHHSDRGKRTVGVGSNWPAYEVCKVMTRSARDSCKNTRGYLWGRFQPGMCSRCHWIWSFD